MDKNKNKKYFNFAEHDHVKIGVLSDTHSYINPSILEHLSDCDIILHAGDIGSIEVIKQLHEISKDVVSVCGNNDNTQQWNIAEHEDLEYIPQIAEIELPGGKIAITHGDEYFSDLENWHESLRTNFPQAKAVVYGHSHRLVCDQNAAPWVLNPGPAGETRIQKYGVSCLLITANKEEWKVSEFRA
jgi:putative phosphoesterase